MLINLLYIFSSDFSVSGEQSTQRKSDLRPCGEYNNIFASTYREASTSQSLSNYTPQYVGHCDNYNYNQNNLTILQNSNLNNRLFSNPNESRVSTITTNITKENVIPKVHKKKKSSKILTRKRKRNKESWLDIQAKKARDSGVEGVGRKGTIKARSMKDGCTEKCRNKCQNKISSNERSAAFTQFWALGDHAKQWLCLTKWVSKENVPKKEDSDSDYFKHIFTLPNAAGEAVIVCKIMFLKTLGI